MDIEKVAEEDPKKIITLKFEISEKLDDKKLNELVEIFKLSDSQKKEAMNLLESIYRILIEKDANLIEINPLIITKKNNLICLDAKMNFDDNALYRQPDILELRDLNEEEPAEIEASKNDLAYIKLNGSIGCMVNGAGLAMATMDIIKLYGKNLQTF